MISKVAFVERKKMYITFYLFAKAFRMQKKEQLFYELYQRNNLGSIDTYFTYEEMGNGHLNYEINFKSFSTVQKIKTYYRRFKA